MPGLYTLPHRCQIPAAPRACSPTRPMVCLAPSQSTCHSCCWALCGGGGDTEAHFPNPPPPSLAAVTGGGGVQGGGARPAVPGRGVNPTSMAQNDTHVALIILTTQMWGGNYWWKKLFRAKFCVPVPLAPTSVLTQNKGPDTEPHFSNPPPPPPSFGGRPCHPPPPPPRRAIFRLPCPDAWGIAQPSQIL